MKYLPAGLLCLLVGAPVLADAPADGWFVWASDREGGRHEIYLMRADRTRLTRLTQDGGKFPAWSPDGAWIAYRRSDTEARVMRWDESVDKKLCDGKFVFWMHDNSGMVCRKGHPFDDYYKVDPDSGKSTLLFRKSDFAQVADTNVLDVTGISHDGRWIVAATDRYRNGHVGSNGDFEALWAAVVLDLQDKSKVYFLGNGCEPTTPPAGQFVYHVRGDGPTPPDVYRMNLADIATRSSYKVEIGYPNSSWGHEYFPRISNDNKWVVYGATTDNCHPHDTCDYEIFVHRLGAGNDDRTRITEHGKNDQWPHLYVGVLPGAPAIGLPVKKLSFAVLEGGDSPSPWTLEVTNASDDTLELLDTAIDYSGDATGWLQVSRTGSGNKQTIETSVLVADLAPGTYSAKVEVACDNATNSPQSYTVSLTIEPLPQPADAGPAAADAGVDVSPSVDSQAPSADSQMSAADAQAPSVDGGSVSSDPDPAPSGLEAAGDETVQGGCAVTDVGAELPGLLILLLGLTLACATRRRR